MTDVLLDLNPEQRAAVEHGMGPVLVVAGAGSGKTRVLTARVAWLLAQGVPKHAILAFTFTNRAAREMRERIERVVGPDARSIWIGTFHATAVRILRREAETLGMSRDFVIYDRDDQEAALEDAMRRLQVPEGEFKLGALIAKISDAKNALATPDDMERTASGPQGRRIADIYRAYQETLARNGALDFDDLIAGTVRLLRDHPQAGRTWAERFQHVLVDEYQDTNHAQFRLVSALAAIHGNVFAVGDDDQSIYGWRGANVGHVLDFDTTFPGAGVVRLEQNYRSTSTILEAANAVIENNRGRKGKTLWSDRAGGAQLRFLLTEDEVDEARRVRGVIADHIRSGGRLDDVAVLYRTNTQSRALETELRKHLVPYQIVGGVPFYQRREVKDLLAYLRLAVNPADEVSFWRVWNTPRRNLGPATRMLVEARMAADGVSPPVALERLATEDALSRAARTGAMELLGVVDELRAQADASLEGLVERLIERIRYDEHLAGDENVKDRLENVNELAAAAAGFAAAERGTLRDFLAEAALVSDADMVDETADRVLLLTAHNAKGLEFPLVIVSGLEEGLFPHANSIADAEKLEEERRLFYVALTRARDKVVMTAAAYRRRFDGSRGGSVSRFVAEIPKHLVDAEDVRSKERNLEARANTWGSGSRRGNGTHGMRHESGGWMTGAARAGHPAIGREVYHETYGRGVVLDAEGQGPDAKYTIRFGNLIRKIVGRFLTEGGHGD